MRSKIMSSALVAMLLCGVSVNAKTLAVVDGEEVGAKDIAMILRQSPGVSYEQLPEEIQKQVLNQAIDRKLLAKQAKKENIQNSKEFKEALEEHKEDLMLEVWMRKQVDGLKIAESEIRGFYNDNKERFIQPELVSAKHILVENEKEAKAIIAELGKAGAKMSEKFSELAKSKSKDPGAQNGGDLGYFSKEQMVPEFANAAFALAKGSYSKTPVKTQFGYHVILVTDKKPQSVHPYEEVKAQIEQNLRLQKFRDHVSSIATKLREKAQITIK